MKFLKRFEYYTNLKLKEGDYIGYKRYFGLPSMIVKIVSIDRSNKYFVESIEHPHVSYLAYKWELEELDEGQIEELNAYLDSLKYNL
jgi:hypothetical protein